MDITVRSGDALSTSSALAVLVTFEGASVPAAVANSFETSDFSGAANQSLMVYPKGRGGPKRVLLVGLGARKGVTAESVRQAAATAIKQARSAQAADITLGLPADMPLGGDEVGQALAEGLELGNYRYLQHQTGRSAADLHEIASVTVFAPKHTKSVAQGVATGSAIARGTNFARDLVNTPGGMKTPPQLAQRAIELGERHPAINVTVYDEVRLEKEGFGGILAVGKGSDSPPRFIIMEYGKQFKGSTVCLVGKGLTFDSGGLNIKPAEGMETMKNDMGGSAAVFGVMQTVAELGLPLHVVGLVPSAENMPSGRSYRPGDIVTTLSGKTIEILNTDAEGRVILSDGLHFAQRYKPAAIVELSTLTGAVIIALGNHATAVMATDQSLADQLVAAGAASGDKAWQLPLWDEYHQMVKSDIADLKNLAGRGAGSITAGAFLSAFAGKYPFAHLDIAGTAWLDAPTKPYLSKGGTGAGVRLVTEFLRTFN
ncbi:MAG: leucyl aminopeptidase [Actinobacteria bacterium]|nr:leucyl aminopeptidase [Actinomycetota bacterium]